jgi:hypothetical protein
MPGWTLEQNLDARNAFGCASDVVHFVSAISIG